ncbi:MAG: hypothetical protein DDG60_14360 [Anaerolineae bacterium]|nr:MAG: hypothetical protein DDG60_14360 [Anaerolineae bacterium]
MSITLANKVQQMLKVMTIPRLVFWRIVLTITGLLAWLAAWQMFGVAQQLGIVVLKSKTWLAFLFGLGLIGCAGFIGAVLTFSSAWKHRFAHFTASVPPLQKLLAAPLLVGALSAYSLLLLHPYYGKLIRNEEAMRLLVFWLLALVGAWLLRTLRPTLDWPITFAVILLLQASTHLMAAYLLGITDYPFALGWSETSRFYYPSLFLSEKIYGERLPWPILHPTLHLVLVPPYWFDAPLWAHRAWQIMIRFALVGSLVPALLSRLNIETALGRFVAGCWMFLALFSLPLYLHLAPPVFLVLWGFSTQNIRRTWLFVLLASIWAGLSRLNWYPVPGMLAAALYLLETPFPKNGGRSTFRYLLQPAAWFIVGSVLAFLSMQVYIALSGIGKTENFYTSLTSSLLWYRLWPNATYSLGVLPGIVLYSLPMWLVLAIVFAQRTIHPLRMGLLVLGLAVLFAGGIVVSMKIGGGGDIHNMDAYAVALLIVSAYLFFGRYAREREETQPSFPIHWAVTALLVLVPVWFIQRAPISLVTYDKAASQAVLAALRQEVEAVHAQGGEILFITQRHLLSMQMLPPVKMVPEYEREELMEMAMANNEAYLDRFKAELRAQRFDLIIVDPLTTNMLGSEYAMGEENNAWVRFAARPILCNYRAKQTFAADRIVLYVPQETPVCP